MLVIAFQKTATMYMCTLRVLESVRYERQNECAVSKTCQSVRCKCQCNIKYGIKFRNKLNGLFIEQLCLHAFHYPNRIPLNDVKMMTKFKVKYSENPIKASNPSKRVDFWGYPFIDTEQ